jgi:uncharacterized protein
MLRRHEMCEFAIWHRLDQPGHDAALLRRSDDGWLLQGTAAFSDSCGPASVAYDVEADLEWRAKRGSVRGFLGDRTFYYDIRRESEGWFLNGSVIEGLKHLVDLDYGFTPATNILHLRRNTSALGKTASFSVAWFDLENGSLTELRQIYERRSETTYWYASPRSAYEGLIEMASSGFVKIYPGLWRLEA